MIAFVAGATGYTGREVVRVVAQRGDRTVAHVRPDSADLDAWRERFAALGAEVDTTPWEEDAMTETLARIRPTTVFALLGTTRARARAEAKKGNAPPTYESVDYGLSALLLRAALRSGARPSFVYLSSMGVRDGTKNPYLAVRWRFETELRESGLPFTIARPSFISGPDREEPRPLERTAATVADTILGAAAAVGIGSLKQRYGSLRGSGLAEALVDAALDPGAEGSILEADALRSRAR